MSGKYRYLFKRSFKVYHTILVPLLFGNNIIDKSFETFYKFYVNISKYS